MLINLTNEALVVKNNSCIEKMNPKVSIIIVNWNGRQYLEECLSSVYAQTYSNFEVIFVDNNSKDGSVEFVATSFPETKVIKNNENLGFAEANNIGIKAANAKYIATLNNDTKADPNWLKEIITVAERADDIGSCASKMLRYKDHSIIDSTGIKLFSTGTVMDRGSEEKDKGQYDKSEEVFGACAGAALYRVEMLNAIGLFPSHYFASYEDVDLAWRARYAGWKCVYVPSAIVYHVRFATQKRLLAKGSTFSTRKLRNQLWCQILFLPDKYLRKNLFRLIKKYLQLILLSIKGGYSDFIKTAGFLPSVLSERYKYQRNRKLDKTEIYKWLERN